MQRALRPVDIASLAAFRIIFGLVMFVGIVRLLSTGWIETMYGDPHFFFTYPGFGWVRPWSVTGMYLHYAVLAVLALGIAAGYRHRLVTLLFVVGFTYTQLVDVTNYLNHHYLVVLLGVQLALLPANAEWSLDARRDPSIRRDQAPVWMIWLLRFQVGVVYVFAGLAKAKADWLLDAQPLQLWLSARTDTPLIGSFFTQPWVPLAMSWAGFLFDTTIVIWLSWARTRIYAFAALILFHGFTGYLFNIGMFPLIMTTSALIFFPPSWPRRLFRAEPAPVTSPPIERPSRIVRTAIAVHVVLQLVLPLRHLAYPGAVLWNEDGMRFAWHVMIREKHGSVGFVARFADGKTLEVPASNYLTARQEREMGAQPDLILQLARRIGEDMHARGYRDFTLHAETAVSLNGRAPRPMIDPRVDLLSIDDLGPRRWVLPGP
ncbi:MAG: HTTM domain-containing protein [Deltaproteobacteria bacterium]|nr:HTTM domain-containing protein [Deltaproteobacteria bacterium]